MTVIESTELRCMYEIRSEHDFTLVPNEIDLDSVASLLGTLQ
jgi:hypothetical protein